MQKFLLAGLGNIGAEYESTRHNIGFDVVEAFAKKHEAVFRSDRLAYVADVKFRGKSITCIKPTTYMNLSGKAVKYWMDKEHINVENVLIIADEIAIPMDKIRLRSSGTHAGHNGLRSIQEILNTDQYPRLRFGVGNDFPRGGQVNYVLGKWNETEISLVRLKIEKCVELLETFVQSGIVEAMNKYNNLRFTL